MLDFTIKQNPRVLVTLTATQLISNIYTDFFRTQLEVRLHINNESKHLSSSTGANFPHNSNNVSFHHGDMIQEVYCQRKKEKK
jgi:predicted transcriptional regulator